MKILTDVYGYDGNDRRTRFKVKKIVEDDFRDQVIFIASVNEPQVVARISAQSSGEVFHSNCHDKILKRAAQILREMVDDFISQEKEQFIWPPTVKSLISG